MSVCLALAVETVFDRVKEKDWKANISVFEDELLMVI